MNLLRVVEHSIAATVTQEAMEIRRSQVAELKPAHIRLAAQSIDAVVFTIPSIKFGVERANMRRNGYELIGYGSEADVYSNGEGVLKYVGRSEYLDDIQKIKLSDKKKTEFDQLQSVMPRFLLDQTITVAPHMGKRGKKVVQTEQRYLQFDQLLQQDGNDGQMKLSGVTTQIKDELSDFVDASWRLFGKTGLLPDTNGSDNIVRFNDQLILIDTQPITPDNMPIQKQVMKQLGSIAFLLETIS